MTLQHNVMGALESLHAYTVVHISHMSRLTPDSKVGLH